MSEDGTFEELSDGFRSKKLFYSENCMVFSMFFRTSIHSKRVFVSSSIRFHRVKKQRGHGIHITQDLSGGDVCIEFGAVNVWKTQIEE